MGSKNSAKTLMEQTGIPLVPGYHGDRQEPAFLREQAKRLIEAVSTRVPIACLAGHYHDTCGSPLRRSDNRQACHLHPLHRFRPKFRRPFPLRDLFHCHPPNRQMPRSVGLHLLQPASIGWMMAFQRKRWFAKDDFLLGKQWNFSSERFTPFMGHDIYDYTNIRIE
jgi:hypothetical protein